MNSLVKNIGKEAFCRVAKRGISFAPDIDAEALFNKIDAALSLVSNQNDYRINKTTPRHWEIRYSWSDMLVVDVHASKTRRTVYIDFDPELSSCYDIAEECFFKVKEAVNLVQKELINKIVESTRENEQEVDFDWI